MKSKLQAWCIRISGRGDGKMAIFLNFKNHSHRILNLGPKIPDLYINNQQWTFKYFSENSSTLIKEKKMRKRLHSITYPASRQYIITLKVLVTYIHLLLLFEFFHQKSAFLISSVPYHLTFSLPHLWQDQISNAHLYF